MRVVVVIVVTWESKANSSSSVTELQTETELGKRSRGSKKLLLNVLMVPYMLYNTAFTGGIAKLSSY